MLILIDGSLHQAYSRLARVEAELHTMALSHHHLEDELLAALRALLARGDELDKVRFWPRLSAMNDHRMTTECTLKTHGPKAIAPTGTWPYLMRAPDEGTRRARGALDGELMA